MLALDGVTVRVGGFSLAADLTVAPGARVAVMGPSGAGKSTLLAGIGGFAETTGAISWKGARIDGMEPGRRPVASLFQEGNLFPHLTAARNVGLGIRPDGRLSPDERARVADALSRVGLSGLEDRRPDSLSGGQRARVALARVAVQSRPLLLLDEAFAALGPALREEMLDRTAGIAEAAGTTMLMVTHLPEDARRVCPQTILVMDGQARPPESTDAILDDPPPALRAYLGGG